MDSILKSVRKLCGLQEDDDVFDTDLIIHTNSVFSILEQLGVGPPEGFTIEDDFTVWKAYIPDNDKLLNYVKAYVPMKVRQLFDPPTGAAADAAIRLIGEYEWRINVAAEEKIETNGGEPSDPSKPDPTPTPEPEPEPKPDPEPDPGGDEGGA